MLSVTNNIASLVAQQNLNNSNNALDTSLQRLSSGLKINTGADGPAALVISNEQGAQIAGLQSAIDNTNQAVSLVQTAEGAYSSINNLLVQIRGLALSAANSGVNDPTATAADQNQIQNALNTIDTIATNTQFGTKKLLDGSAGKQATGSSTLANLSATTATTVGTYTLTTVQAAQKGVINLAGTTAGILATGTGLGQNETLTFTGGNAGTTPVTVQLTAGQTNAQVASTINTYTGQTGVVASLDATTGSLVLTAQNFGQGFKVASDTAAATAGSTGIGTTTLDTTVTGATGSGVTQLAQAATVTLTDASGNTYNTATQANVVNSTTGTTVNFINGGLAGLSFTLGASAASATTTGIGAQGSQINVTDGSLTFQIGANGGQTASVSLSNSSTASLGVNASTVFGNLNAIRVDQSSTNTTEALKVIDAAISQISTLSGNLGAFQTNILQATASNLQTALTNTTSAQSTIRDTNFASETANFTKNQVLVQAGTTVLTNANATSQLILNLLK